MDRQAILLKKNEDLGNNCSQREGDDCKRVLSICSRFPPSARRPELSVFIVRLGEDVRVPAGRRMEVTTDVVLDSYKLENLIIYQSDGRGVSCNLCPLLQSTPWYRDIPLDITVEGGSVDLDRGRQNLLVHIVNTSKKLAHNIKKGSAIGILEVFPHRY